MATDNTVAIKITLLADGLKQGLANAKQGFDNLKQAASSNVSGGLVDNLADKLKFAESEIKKAIEDLIRLKQAANGKTGALGESLANEIRKAEAEIKKAEAALNKLKGQFNSGVGSNLAASAKKDLQDVGAGAGLANRTLADLKGTIASVFAVGALIAFTNKLVDAVKVIQDLRIRLSGLTKTAQDYAASEAYLVDLSHRHHKNVQDLTSSYASFLALEQSGIITRQQSIQLLEGFSNAASKTGASNTQMSQSTYGLAQALGTGIVAMEEFKQITEPMPGLAYEIAKSFGMTVGQLRVMIGTGTVTSEVFGTKFVQALKAYEGAAERAGGTVSASYNDIGNAYTEMAKELEKPVATAVLSAVDVGKSAYGWLKDNGDSIVTTLTLIAVTMAGKAAAGVAAYTASVAASIREEQASIAATIQAAEARVKTKTVFLETAKAKLADAAANTEIIKSNLALVQSDIRAEAATIAVANATIARTRAEVAALSATVQTTSVQYLLTQSTAELTAAEQIRAASMANAAALGKQAALVTKEVTAATQSQIKANHLVVNSAIAQTAAQNALNTSLNASGVAMTRLGTAAKSAMAFVGGPVGAAVIGLYALYEVLNKVTDAEGKAEAKAKGLADSLELVKEQIKDLSKDNVDFKLDETTQQAEVLRAKIAQLEEFTFDNITHFLGNSNKRQALIDDLELAGQKMTLLEQKGIDLIKNFDAQTLASSQLPSALATTETAIKQLGDEWGALDKKRLDSGNKLSADEIARMNKLMLYMNAYEAQHSGIQQRIAIESNTATDVVTKKAEAASKAKIKATQDEVKESGAVIDAETKRQNEANKEALAQRKADIAGMAISELEKELLITQAIKASNAAQLLIIKQGAAGEIAVIDSVYSKKIEQVGKNATEIQNLDKQSLLAKIGVYQAQEKSYGTMINGLIAEEQKLAADSLKLAEQRKGIEQSYEDFKTGLLISSKTGWEKDVAERAQLDKLVADQKKAAAAGDIKSAEEYDTKILELGKKLATAQQESINAGHGFQGQYDDIIKITDKAQAGLLATNQSAQDSNKQRLGELSASAEEAKAALGSVQTVIGQLNQELQTKHSLKIDPDTQAVDDAIARISKPTHSTHTVDIIENRVQAKAAGGYIALNAYAGGGNVAPPDLFPRKQGAISGKGTGTSDEVPAMLSNGEYVVTAEKVRQYGVSAFDDINYGNKSPEQINVNKYATGGVVGDDKLKQKVAELKKQAYEQTVSVFNDPRNYVVWSMKEGATSSGIEDPNSQRLEWEHHAGEYLRANGLPHEFLADYLANKKAKDVMSNRHSSFEQKAAAQLEIENRGVSSAPADSQSTRLDSSASAPIPAQPASAAPPVLTPPALSMPSITPANFAPVVSRSSTPVQASGGKTSTVKFVSPDGNTTTGQSADPNFAAFFDNLNTVAGVTK